MLYGRTYDYGSTVTGMPFDEADGKLQSIALQVSATRSQLSSEVKFSRPKSNGLPAEKKFTIVFRSSPTELAPLVKERGLPNVLQEYTEQVEFFRGFTKAELLELRQQIDAAIATSEEPEE